MDGYKLLLIALVILLLALGYNSLDRDSNWSKTAVAISTATYCKETSCYGEQKVISEYIYPGEPLGCASEARVFRYFIMVGKVLVPNYDTYYIKSDTCQILYITNP